MVVMKTYRDNIPDNIKEAFFRINEDEDIEGFDGYFSHTIDAGDLCKVDVLSKSVNRIFHVIDKQKGADTKLLNDWLISNGAEYDEEVLIYCQ